MNAGIMPSDDGSSSLDEMYQNLTNEQEELEKKIKENLYQISEIDEYLDSIYKKEEEDFKIFSPRSVDSIYKEDIENHKTKRNELEIDNRSLYSRLNKVNSYLEGLKEAESNKQPAQKNYQVLDIQEKERHRIARDLHDTTLQSLTHLVHKVELASLYMDKDVLQAKLELVEISKNLKTVIEEMRNTVFDLRPMHFDDLGLKETLERLFVRLKETNTSFDFYTVIDDIYCENELVKMSIFRVVQEACYNAVKHSGGNKITVKVEQKGKQCHILIRDNGVGFAKEDVSEKSNSHFGVSIMKERVSFLGGTIFINPIPKEGTEIKIMIPLD